MQSVTRELFESETLVNVEDRIAPVDEIFRLQDAEEYSAAEQLYLSAVQKSRSAIVLAASRGHGLAELTIDRPKVMLPIAGKPLLRWLVDGFKRERIDDITVVGGYRADAIDPSGIKLTLNERYAETGELTSLSCAIGAVEGDTVIAYGDLIFRSYVLRDLLESDADFAVVVDSSPSEGRNQTVRDFAYCSEDDDRGLFQPKVLLQRITSGGAVSSATAAGSSALRPQGRWIGLFKASRRGLVRLKQVLATLQASDDFNSLDMPHLLNALIDDGAAIEALYIHGHWRGVNDLDEFRSAMDFAHAQNPSGSPPPQAPTLP
jgi:phosphoenolpyruvate phosphomutase